MNKLNTAKRVQVIASLVEGNSINSTVRMTGISKPTILKLIAELGEACWAFHCDRVRGPVVSAHPVRRALGVLLREGEERATAALGHAWLWRRVDVDRDRR